MPAWLRNFVAACGLARSTAAYGGGFGVYAEHKAAKWRTSAWTLWFHGSAGGWQATVGNHKTPPMIACCSSQVEVSILQTL